MAVLDFVITGATCGAACWEAREESCRCSCRGQAHGILAHGGSQPRRTAKIMGERYVLGAVNASWSETNTWAWGIVQTEYANVQDCYKPWWHSHERGSIAITKTANPSQMRWPEIHGQERASITWVREDWIERYDRDHSA